MNSYKYIHFLFTVGERRLLNKHTHIGFCFMVVNKSLAFYYKNDANMKDARYLVYWWNLYIYVHLYPLENCRLETNCFQVYEFGFNMFLKFLIFLHWFQINPYYLNSSCSFVLLIMVCYSACCLVFPQFILAKIVWVIHIILSMHAIHILFIIMYFGMCLDVVINMFKVDPLI